MGLGCRRRVGTLRATERRLHLALAQRRRADFARALQSTALRKIAYRKKSTLPSFGQALSDLKREPVLVLNGVFYGERQPRSFDDFLAKLRGLCAAIADERRKEEDRKERFEALLEAVVLRMSRTRSGADAYASLVDLLALDKENGDGDSSSFVVRLFLYNFRFFPTDHAEASHRPQESGR